jgi:hypothetical protein
MEPHNAQYQSARRRADDRSDAGQNRSSDLSAQHGASLSPQRGARPASADTDGIRIGLFPDFPVRVVKIVFNRLI